MEKTFAEYQLTEIPIHNEQNALLVASNGQDVLIGKTMRVVARNGALKKADCDQIYTDTASGSSAERTGLEAALSRLRKGDTLVVWRLDRLGRSLRHLIDTITALDARGIGFRSITEAIDTTTSGGKLVFHIFGALAEFERDIIRERTQAGLQAARARGHLGGRPKRQPSSRKVAMARALYADKSQTVAEICKILGISRATLYRYIDEKP